METEAQRSPLEVTYAEVQANPWVCEGNPLSARADVFGRVTLWEGKKNPKDKNSPNFRVLKTKERTLLFERFDKRTNEWVGVSELPPLRFFRRKLDRPEPGVVRLELFDNPSRLIRTVG